MTEKLPDIPQAYQPPPQAPVDAYEPPLTPPVSPYEPYRVSFPLPDQPPGLQRRDPRSRAGLVLGAVAAALVLLGGLVVLAARQPGGEAPPAAAPVAAPAEVAPADPIEEPAGDALPELAALPGSAESEQRDAGDGTVTSIQFLNTTAEPVTVMWVNYEQKRVWYANLAPGQRYDQQTYAGHAWVVTRSDGTAIAVYEATAQASRAVIR